jgi:membrane protease YdiL (CAAX protease family)
MPEALRFVFFNNLFFNDRGLRAGWRLLIFILIFSVLMFAVVFPVSAVLQRQTPRGALTAGFQTFGDSLIFLLLLLASWIMSRIERRPMGEYGLPLKSQPVISRFTNGYLFWGFIPLSLCLLVLHLLRASDYGSLALHGPDILRFGAEWAVAFLVVALSEEYLLRGYALYTLADGIGFWPASIVLAVLFGMGHSRNPGETRIGIVATVLFALFASATLRLTGNLWLAVGAHAGWDWGQSYFYGVSDSGIVAQGHLLNPSFHGPDWLTGGTVGPEGSVVTLILWAVMFVAFVLIYRNRREPALVVTTAAATTHDPV